MADETDVNAEVVAQEASQVSQEQDQAQVQQTEESKKKDEEVNWKKARELLETQKRENDALKAEMRRYQEERVRSAKPPQSSEEDELMKLSDDDILTKKQAEKLSEIKARKMFEEFENQRGEEKARSETSDYDAIVNQENLERLQRDHPEIVESLKATPQLYHKAKGAYKIMKAFYGANDKESIANKENLEKNLAKPRSVNSLGTQSALSQAHVFERGLTPEVKKQLLSEMISASKKM